MSLITDNPCACVREQVLVLVRRANDYIRAELGENVFEPWVDVRDDPATVAALEAEASEQGPDSIAKIMV